MRCYAELSADVIYEGEEPFHLTRILQFSSRTFRDAIAKNKKQVEANVTRRFISYKRGFPKVENCKLTNLDSLTMSQADKDFAYVFLLF